MNGAPSAAHTTSGNTSISPTASGHTRGRTPLAACRLSATPVNSTVPSAPSRNAPSTHQSAVPQSTNGTFSPRLDRNTPGIGFHDCRGAGSDCSAMYQNSSCSSTGTSRTTST